MSKTKKCFITPELRPYVRGSHVNPQVITRNIEPDNQRLTTVTILAASEDSTAQYFLNYCSKNGYDASIVPLDNIDSVDNFLSLILRKEENFPGIYYRDIYTSDIILSQMLVYLTAVLTFYPGKILNKPSTKILNNSKPLQISTFGDYWPNVVSGINTWVTNKASSLKEHKSEFIVKSISSVRSNVVDLCDSNLSMEALSDIGCPLQIQDRLTGENVRVHMIDEECIAIKIITDSIDYRTDDNIDCEIINLPEKIKNWCISAAQAENLNFVGIDLLKSYDDIWYCFEINPTPGYHFYEKYIFKKYNITPISKLLYLKLF